MESRTDPELIPVNRFLAARIAGEAAGTAMLVGIGTGAIVLSARLGGIAQWEIATAWFFAVLLPMLLFIQLSGAHLNPAVTLALAASGRVAWKEVPPYFLGQFGGAFLGSAIVFWTLGDYSHLGATVPTVGELSVPFILEFVFTALLIGAVFFLSDRGQGDYRWRLFLPPMAVGLATFAIGPITGCSLNPARTIAPAILSTTYGNLWIYLIAVPLAALTVGLLWKPRTVDILDRGPGRWDVST
jgi:aquaporin NIP